MTFDAEWSRCGDWIKAALAHAGGVYTLSDVEFMVRTGDARFWPGAHSAMISRVEVYPRARWLLLWLAGGELVEIRDDLVPVAEAWGKSQGCTKSIIMGRAGWSKALSSAGYGSFAVVVGKDLAV